MGESKFQCLNSSDDFFRVGKGTTGKINGHEYVDLGLSVKWATCNVGASSPSDYGDYYAWGEIETKSEYTESNCVTYGRQMRGIAGNPHYDAARANWGGTWRMPTKEEIDELVDKCTWKWVEKDGHEGYEVTGPNGNSIFLPAAGFRYESSPGDVGERGSYWSATPVEDDAGSAYGLGFDKDLFYRDFDYRDLYGADSAYGLGFDEDLFYRDFDYRDLGWVVRPVMGKTSETGKSQSSASSSGSATTSFATNSSSDTASSAIGKINGHEYVDLGLSVKWATCNVGASSPSDYGNYYAWGETTPKSEYTLDNSVTFGKKMGSIAGDPHFDVATANWGGTWRMPTKEEIDELVDKCTWKWVEKDGHEGYEVTGLNGNSVFLPAAGFRYESPGDMGEGGDYLSATPDEDDANCACGFYFSKGNFFRYYWVYRCYGQSVRPVSD